MVFHECPDIHIHPDYTHARSYNDIGILELEQPVTYSENIYPICLNTKIEDPTDVAYVTGWGLTRTDGTASPWLIKVELPIVPLEQCRQFFPDYEKIRLIREGIQDTQICAYDRKQKKDSCKGDSGGPLILALDLTKKYFSLIGIVAAGDSCGSNSPGIYTRVASFLNFIERIVWPRGVN
ncbi:serine protease persephone-like [Musca autumnalis]|uniref:serine protease persephone-like n=1 Tax=Musca autumnalis TaxID=221902 RepID=UPI003CFB94DC